MKSKTENCERQNLACEEWDFRGINSKHLELAWEYELARQHPRLNEALKFLAQSRRKEIANLTAADFWKGPFPLLAAAEYEDIFALIVACWYCPEFPEPWMALTEDQKQSSVDKHSNEKNTRAIEVLSGADLIELAKPERNHELNAWLSGSNSNCDFLLKINWSRPPCVIEKELLDLLTRRPAVTLHKKAHTGRRAADPIFRFKQLAAWRLANLAHLCYKDAQMVVEEQKRKPSKEGFDDILPSYASPGAWKTAVDKISGYIKFHEQIGLASIHSRRFDDSR